MTLRRALNNEQEYHDTTRGSSYAVHQLAGKALSLMAQKITGEDNVVLEHLQSLGLPFIARLKEIADRSGVLDTTVRPIIQALEGLLEAS